MEDGTGASNRLWWFRNTVVAYIRPRGAEPPAVVPRSGHIIISSPLPMQYAYRSSRPPSGRSGPERPEPEKLSVGNCGAHARLNLSHVHM